MSKKYFNINLEVGGGGGGGERHTVAQLVAALRHMPGSTQPLTKKCTTNISFGTKTAGEYG